MADPTIAFPTGTASTLNLAVPNYADAQAAGNAIAANLGSEFAAGSITSYSYNGSGSSSPPPTNNELVLTGNPGFVVLSPSTSAVLNNSSRPVFIAGGTNANVDLVSVSNLTYNLNTGTGRVVADGAANFISSAVTNGGNHGIYLGDGTNIVSAFSGNDTISAGTGSNTVTFGTGNNVFTSRGTDKVQAYNPGGTVPGGTDVIDASGNTHSVTADGGKNNLVFVNGSGASTLTGDAGSDTVFAGAGGGNYVGGSAGNNFFIGGAGAATLTGGGNGDILLAGGNKGDVLQAGSGSEALSSILSGGNDTLTGGSGSDVLTGGFGNDLIVAGTGNDLEVTGVNSSVFRFVNGAAGGQDEIVGFGLVSGNKLNLSGYGSNAVTQAVATQQNTGGNTFLTLSDNTKIELLGVKSVSASNFV